jgi:hypothetical protein
MVVKLVKPDGTIIAFDSKNQSIPVKNEVISLDGEFYSVKTRVLNLESDEDSKKVTLSTTFIILEPHTLN